MTGAGNATAMATSGMTDDLSAPGPALSPALSSAPLQAAEPTGAESLAQLRELVEAGTVWIEIDRRKLSSIDFPLAVEADGNRLAYGAAIPIGIAFWWGGPIWGFSVLIAAFILYQTWGHHHIARRLLARIETAGLVNLELWRKLWRFGGLTLVTEDDRTCMAPDGRWMSFVAEVRQAQGSRVAAEVSAEATVRER